MMQPNASESSSSALDATGGVASFISTQVTKGEYYYLNLTPRKDSAEAVVCGGREQCAPNYYIERSHFMFYSIEFVASGKGTLTTNGRTFDLIPGMIYCYGPRTHHVIETDPEQPMLKYFVDFVGSELVSLLKHTEFGRGRPLYAARPFLIRNIFENLNTTGNAQIRHADTLCALLLRQLILLADATTMSTETANSLAWQTYFRCRQYMERNILGIGSVKDAADQCFVDPSYLARLFNRFADESPLKLINRLKMNKAAELLGTKNMLIKQVAEELGFSDPYHFSRVFKRVFGIPPETFSRTVR